jgi:hypothetical protein
MDLAIPYVFVVTWMTPFRGLIWAPVCWLFDIFHWLQLSDSACCPLCDEIVWDWSVIKFGTLESEKSLYAQVIALQSSACLILALFTYGHRHVCERTYNVYCGACGQLTLFWLWMPILTLQLFSMVWYDHRVLRTAVHNIPLHFCCEELLLSRTKAVPLYEFPFLNRVTNTDVICLCTAVNIPLPVFVLSLQCIMNLGSFYCCCPLVPILRLLSLFQMPIILRSSTELSHLIADLPTRVAQWY